jgi:hypothetical protein
MTIGIEWLIAAFIWGMVAGNIVTRWVQTGRWSLWP